MMNETGCGYEVYLSSNQKLNSFKVENDRFAYLVITSQAELSVYRLIDKNDSIKKELELFEYLNRPKVVRN